MVTKSGEQSSVLEKNWESCLAFGFLLSSSRNEEVLAANILQYDWKCNSCSKKWNTH